ncbi:hypothetical protein FGO68_gene3882 [Halteria grandinella]|uniref:Uncharacterized protein n=1 Tax=Halteria grandinella TaxID=5974 RepID=A0A8J8NXI0_HALGN|nr:hypothetical protein FGO68_gene3882 [Halteria grandinella]
MRIPLDVPLICHKYAQKNYDEVALRFHEPLSRAALLEELFENVNYNSNKDDNAHSHIFGAGVTDEIVFQCEHYCPHFEAHEQLIKGAYQMVFPHFAHFLCSLSVIIVTFACSRPRCHKLIFNIKYALSQLKCMTSYNTTKHF